MGNLTANQAKETSVFYLNFNKDFCNYDVLETNLYDFVMESEDVTTSPRGVEPRIFYEENTQITYISKIDNSKIDNLEYEFLDNDEKKEFDYLCEEGSEFEIFTWGALGNKKKSLGIIFQSEDQAIDFIFQGVYNSDFQGDCNRDTTYFFSHVEAENNIFEMYSEKFEISIDTAKSIYLKQLKIKNRLIEIAEKKKFDFENLPKRTAEDMISFIKENKELIQTKKLELSNLKAKGDKENWQVKANALVQIVSKNDFRVLKWREIYELIKKENQ